MISRRSLIANATLVAGASLLRQTGVAAVFPNHALPLEAPKVRASFNPGELWLDTTGKPIQAHGGSIIQAGDRYYWYGENKEFTTGKTGIWTSGDLHPGDKSRTSFNSQISSVFKYPKKDLYIALADRWWGPRSGTEFDSGETSRLVQSAIGKAVGSPRQPMTPAESRSLMLLSVAIDTSQSRYVWLPIRFDGERPVIEWRDEWSLSEFV